MAIIKKPVKWTPVIREILNPVNSDVSKSVEKWIIDESDRPVNSILEIDNKTGEYFWVTGIRDNPNNNVAYRKSSNNKYVFDNNDVEYN
jgi:hypothetical protein